MYYNGESNLNNCMMNWEEKREGLYNTLSTLH